MFTCLLSFCVFDYEFIDAVGVFAVRYQLVAILKQALKDEAVFCACQPKIVFSLSHTNTTSEYTISVTHSPMLFILRKIQKFRFLLPTSSDHIPDNYPLHFSTSPNTSIANRTPVRNPVTKLSAQALSQKDIHVLV